MTRREIASRGFINTLLSSFGMRQAPTPYKPEWYPIDKNGSWTKRIQDLVVHHTATVYNGTTIEDMKREIDKFNRIHKEKDWGGGARAASVTYHYFVDPMGRVLQVNNDNEITWHAQEANPTSIAICVLGNYETQEPTMGLQYGLRDLVNHLAEKHGLSVQDDLFWHNEVQQAATLCCGRNLQRLIQYIRNS